jgi:hypothetical protein
VRYVDDFALFHGDPAVLAKWRARIGTFLEGRRLLLHPRKTAVLASRVPAPFLGFVLLADGGRHLPGDNIVRFRARLSGLRRRWRGGTAGRREVESKVRSWVAHAEHADSWRLRKCMFRGGWFAPNARASQR